MAELEYPRNTVWYLEVRPLDLGSGHAQEDPASMGSAVVVEIEHKDEQNGKSEVKKYLLTCAHVVRARDHKGRPGLGGLFGEILCFKPGQGYVRTIAGRRKSLETHGCMIARVSPLSPCEGVTDALPEDLHEPHHDWVLLDVQDPSFQAWPAVACVWEERVRRKRLSIIGYPGGAGASKQAGEGHYWDSGDLVESYASHGYSQGRSPGLGMIKPEGPDETRPGMSGGGVFTRLGTLAGLHRAATDISMSRHSVSAQHIKSWLRSHRGARPVDGPPRFWLRQWLQLPELRWTAGMAAASVIGLALWLASPRPSGPDAAAGAGAATPAEPQIINLEITVGRGDGAGSRLKPVPGLKVQFEPLKWKAENVTAAQTDDQGNGVIQIQLKPGEVMTRLFGYLVCENTPDILLGKDPLILEPYGMADQGSFKSLVVLDLARNTQAEMLSVEGLEDWKKGRFQMATANVAAASSATAPGEKTLEQIVLGAKVELAAQGIKDQDFDRVAKDWLADLAKDRPVLPVTQQTPFYSPLQASQNKKTLASVGALYGLLDEGGPLESISTAFVVGKDVVLTVNFGRMSVGEQWKRSSISFSERPSPLLAAPVQLGAILWTDSKLHCCLVQVTGPLPPPLPLAQALPENKTGRRIFVAGYPNKDSRLPEELSMLFAGNYGRKSVMPGELIDPAALSFSFGSREDDLYYDSTTSATGGGPVIDIRTQVVLSMNLLGVWEGVRKMGSGPSFASFYQDETFRALVEEHGGRFVPVEESTPIAPVVSAATAPGLTIPYDPGFLGSPVPLPTLAGTTAATAPPLDYIHYSLVMNEERRMARYAVCNVDRARLLNLPREADRWLLDERLDSALQPGPEIYQGNEWDRGHVCRPSSLRWGELLFAKAAYQSAFYLTNATPQHRNFNQGRWMKLERDIYERLYPDSERITVFSGPVFRDTDIEYRGIRIPQSYWILALYENEKDPSRPHVAASLANQYTLLPDGGYEPASLSDEGSLSDDGSPEDLAATVKTIQQLTRLTFTLPTNSGQ